MDSDSSTKFIGSLTKFLQSLCNGYVEFQRGVELVGHIYLSIDTGEKVDYILHERVSKNDENSVTFVSNSFHALPHDKEKTPENKDNSSKFGAGSKSRRDSSDDDDIMIVDQSKRVPGSSNSGSIPVRGVKRGGSPSSSERHAQRMRGVGGPSSASNRGSSSFQQNNRQHSGASQSTSQQEGLNISDVKLEQISKDELMTLASQVGDGGSRPPHAASASHSHSPRSEGAMWIKQEAADDDDGGGNETGWSHGRDDSNSNSGSNLYPVMLHQNPAAYSGPAFPGFPGHGSGSQSATNPYADPLPGTSQDSSGLDPSDLDTLRSSLSQFQRRQRLWVTDKPLSSFTATERESRYVQYRRHIKLTNPARYQIMKERQRECMKKLRARRKQERAQISEILKNQPLFYHGAADTSSLRSGGGASVWQADAAEADETDDEGN
ncbi:uncharacterized protein LOC143299761 isoform X4 [Babylonia areolata]|uniref:uncharacterized protein LOC143299761 isoform X4 n=1 Tax=Babylonia areolata TaxID=304850 RepID=UPI003FCFCFF1